MTAAALGAYIVFEDEAGFSMTPPCSGRRYVGPVQGQAPNRYRGPLLDHTAVDGTGTDRQRLGHRSRPFFQACAELGITPEKTRPYRS